MKHMKKLAAMIAALALTLCVAGAAFAAESKTISVASDDTRSYDVYQIFTGDLHKGILSNVVWGQNGTGEAGKAVDGAILDALEAVNGATDVEQLAVIEQYVNLGSTPFGTVSVGNPLTAPTGYYLFVDKGELAPGEAYSLYVVQIVGDTVINPKLGSVESCKKVDDKNDSNATEDDVDWQDSADYDIGDAVPFQLTGTVAADYANYKAYYYAFHDVESAGLTFDPKSVKVYVDGTEITTGFEVVTSCTDGCTFEIVFADLKKIAAVKANSTITVEYTSTLNDNAVLGSKGNPNVMYLEYSNNPNSKYDGTENTTPETSDTIEDKVIVFTYQVVVNKIDEAENPLQGAGFTLYKKTAAGEWDPVGAELKGDALTQFIWKGIDDGDYKLVETTTPAGYNTIADILFTVCATHDLTADDPHLTELLGGDTFTGAVGTGALNADIVNKAGTVLPETGGIGTVMFYAIGGLLVIGAVALLVTRRRSSVEE